MRVILSGGGTGGHIYPALAVAQALRQQDSGGSLELLYVGVRGRLDEAIVGPAGLPFAAVLAGPLRGGSPLRAVSSVLKLLAGTAQAWRILGRFRPDAVFATGGYASVPVGIAARLRGRPLLVYLPDVRPGWAVRLLSRLAQRMATATERALDELPPGKAEAVGYPVRDGFWTADRAQARRSLGLPPGERVLLVAGASQGSQAINRAVAAQLGRLLERCHVLHLSGRRDETETLRVRDALPQASRERYHVFGYLEEMPQAMAAADLAVLRAGASVLGELTAAGLPALLVPGPFSDQQANADYLAERGAAVVLANDRLDTLADIALPLLDDEDRRRGMAEAARRLAKRDAASRIAELVRGLAAQGAAA